MRRREDGARDGIERQLALDGAKFIGRARHAVDDAGLLVLPERLCPCLAHASQALGTIGAHAREDDAERAAADGLGHGFEQHVDGRAVAIDARPARTGGKEAASRTHTQMLDAERDIDVVVEQPVAICCFLRRKH